MVAAAVSIVTLGVADVSRSQAFYESLGWQVVVAADDGLRVFSTRGAWLALYPRDKLAQDAGYEDAGYEDAGYADAGYADAGSSWPAGRFRDVALALNLDGEAAVDEAIAAALGGGGRLLRPATKMHWGGYSGYVSDPDGHAWEIAFNPFWPLGPDGRPQIS
jgi:catechol 2,3-dioxygenase-like lactoylglutathione lyase family enzyme